MSGSNTLLSEKSDRRIRACEGLCTYFKHEELMGLARTKSNDVEHPQKEGVAVDAIETLMQGRHPSAQGHAYQPLRTTQPSGVKLNN